MKKLRFSIIRINGIMLIVILLNFSSQLFSQGAAVNTSGANADPSAMLDVSSTTAGILIPRMNTIERNAIPSPAEGLQVFNTDSKCFEFYAYNTWHTLGCAQAPFTCGNTITDPRDSKTYNTVLIGTQCWFAENLDYGTMATLTVSGNQNFGEKFCIGNNSGNCAVYGGLYEWNAMMNNVPACNGTGSSQPECSAPVQGVCPPGWHIPSHYEWTLLEKNLGSAPLDFEYDETSSGWFGTDEGNNIKESGTAHWTAPNSGATNSSGFTALPGGYAWYGFDSYNHYGFYWSSSEDSPGSPWYRSMHWDSPGIGRDLSNGAMGYSVRCVLNN